VPRRTPRPISSEVRLSDQRLCDAKTAFIIAGALAPQIEPICYRQWCIQTTRRILALRATDMKRAPWFEMSMLALVLVAATLAGVH